MGPYDPSLSGLTADERTGILGISGSNQIVFAARVTEKVGAARASCSLFQLRIAGHILRLMLCQCNQPISLKSLRLCKIEALAIFIVPVLVMSAFGSILKFPWSRPNEDKGRILSACPPISSFLAVRCSKILLLVDRSPSLERRRLKLTSAIFVTCDTLVLCRRTAVR